MFTFQNIIARSRLTVWLSLSLLGLTLPVAHAQADARAELKGKVSGVISQARKFVLGGTSYYVVVREPYLNGGKSIEVLQKAGTAYLKVYGTSVDWTGPDPDKLTVLDLNKDGRVELFFEQTACGTVGCTSEYMLVNTADQRWYTGPTMGSEVDYGPELMKPVNRPFLNYFISRLQPLEESEETKDSLGTGAWYERYAAFSNGQVRSVTIKPKYAPISDCPLPAGSVVASVWIGDTKFVSEFKGNVLGLNYKKGTCFLVMMPKNSYEWIGGLKNVGGQLALIDRNNGAIFGRFNPRTFELKR